MIIFSLVEEYDKLQAGAACFFSFIRYSTLPDFSLYIPQRYYPAGRKKKVVKALKFFTPGDIRGIIEEGENPANLDNFDNANRTRNAVQMTREMTTSNGCHITLFFPKESRPGVRRKIAEMLLTAMEKGTEES